MKIDVIVQINPDRYIRYKLVKMTKKNLYIISRTPVVEKIQFQSTFTTDNFQIK